MKRIVLTLLICSFVSLLSYSQIQKIETSKKEMIGKIAPMGALNIQCEKSDDVYIFMYRDVKYTQIVEFKSFVFKDIDNAFDGLYDMIMKGFKNPPKEDIMLELPDDIIWLNYTKAMGVVNFRFMHSPGKNSEVMGVSGWLTKKKVNKLFGKK